MGHLELRTTQKYTHLNTSAQEGPHESLSAALPRLHALVAQKTRPRGKKVGGPTLAKLPKPQQNRVVTFTRPTRQKRVTG
jgi:hypothetical protein